MDPDKNALLIYLSMIAFLNSSNGRFAESVIFNFSAIDCNNKSSMVSKFVIISEGTWVIFPILWLFNIISPIYNISSETFILFKSIKIISFTFIVCGIVFWSITSWGSIYFSACGIIPFLSITPSAPIFNSCSSCFCSCSRSLSTLFFKLSRPSTSVSAFLLRSFISFSCFSSSIISS